VHAIARHGAVPLLLRVLARNGKAPLVLRVFARQETVPLILLFFVRHKTGPLLLFLLRVLARHEVVALLLRVLIALAAKEPRQKISIQSFKKKLRLYFEDFSKFRSWESYTFWKTGLSVPFHDNPLPLTKIMKSACRVLFHMIFYIFRIT
jgi:hypothetical protein